ncbi:transposase [Pandoraea terrae]|uniref:Transposase n=1 Tax=Pandoraea terrae TaxID=1537710 RepID=A0A5E4Z9P8_9BURK|nr:transposase [Pandoraea terrae]
MRQVMVRGLKKIDQLFVLSMAAYNLVRMRSLGQIRAQWQYLRQRGQKPTPSHRKGR